MTDDKVIRDYLDSQSKCIDELMRNSLPTIKKIFQILNKAKKMEIKFTLWVTVEVHQLQLTLHRIC